MKPRLRQSLTLLNIGAATFMLYAVSVACPAQTDFFRELGASKLHFGLLGGIPLIALGFQFLGALYAGHVGQRKPIIIAFTTAARLMFLPIVLTPFLRHWIPDNVLVVIILCLSALSGALINFEVPLYFSWVADLTPARVLNRYFGNRQRWMSVANFGALIVTAVFVNYSGLSSLIAYPIIMAIAIPIGLIEPTLFQRAEEPPHNPSRGLSWQDCLIAPLRHREYRGFLTFSCYWNFAVMTASSFLALYAMECLKLSVFQVTMLLAVQVAGGALLSPMWGRLADKHGQRPIMLLCVFFKAGVVISHMVATPETAIAILVPVLILDGGVNAGLTIASNGFMLKLAPRESRSAFVAVMTGLSGIAGGVSSILSGAFLDEARGFHFSLVGREWNHFHLLFLVSVLLRLMAIPIAWRIREPESSTHMAVLKELGGMPWVRWIVSVPVGIYETLAQVVTGEGSRRRRDPPSS